MNDKFIRTSFTSSSRDEFAPHLDASNEIQTLSELTDIIGNEVLILEDPLAGNAKKKITISNIINEATDQDAIHKNISDEINSINSKEIASLEDIFIIEDSESGWSKKKLSVNNLTKWDVQNINSTVILTNSDYNKAFFCDSSLNTIDITLPIIDINHKGNELVIIHSEYDPSNYYGITVYTQGSNTFTSGAISHILPNAYNIILTNDGNNFWTVLASNSSVTDTIEANSIQLTDWNISNGTFSINHSPNNGAHVVLTNDTHHQNSAYLIPDSGVELSNLVVTKNQFPVTLTCDTQVSNLTVPPTGLVVTTDYIKLLPKVPNDLLGWNNTLNRPRITDLDYNSSGIISEYSPLSATNRIKDLKILPGGSIICSGYSNSASMFIGYKIIGSDGWYTLLAPTMSQPSFNGGEHICLDNNGSVYIFASFLNTLNFSVVVFNEKQLRDNILFGTVQYNHYYGSATSQEVITCSCATNDNNILIGTGIVSGIGQYARILKGYNGTWVEKALGTSGEWKTKSICYTEYNTIKALMSQYSSLAESYILTSFDNGENWAALSANLPCIGDQLLSIGNNVVLLLGGLDGGGSRIFKSIDGGINFDNSPIYTFPTPINKIEYIGNKILVAIGSGIHPINDPGTFYISYNDGETWEQSEIGNNLIDFVLDPNTISGYYINNDSLTNDSILKKQFSQINLKYKSHFIECEHDLSYGARRVQSVSGTGNNRFNFTIPIDFNDFGPAGGAWAVGFCSTGTDGPNKNITFTDIEYDSGIGTSHDEYLVSGIMYTYDFTGMLNKRIQLNFTPFLSSILACATGGIRITHNSIGGAIYYSGIFIIYRAK